MYLLSSQIKYNFISKKIILFVCLMAIFISIPIHAEVTSNKKIINYNELKYKWGDSPVDLNGKFVWLEKNYNNTEWETTIFLFNPTGREGNNYIWYKFKLPDIQYDDPTLYLTFVYCSFEIFLENEIIYKYNQLKPGLVYGEKGFASHIIPIKTAYKGKTVSIRVFSDYSHIGIVRSPKFGSKFSLLSTFIVNDIEKIVIVFIAAFIGIVSFISFIIFRQQKAFLSLSIFSISISILSFIFTDTKGFFLDSINEKFWIISIFCLPIGVYSFVDFIFGPGYKSIIRRTWQTMVILSVIFIALINFNIISSETGRIIYIFPLIVGIIFTLSFIIKLVREDNTSARIFLIALIILFLTGIVDYSMTISYVQNVYDFSQNPLSTMGYLSFIILLVVILVRRFLDIYKNLQVANKEIEHYSNNLEEMVKIRTYELHELTKELVSEKNKLKSRNEIMEKDLVLARKIQQNLIPARNPTEYISSLYMPMEQVGGDFYDFIFYREKNKIGIFLSDVSGHGSAAAFITSMLKTILLQSGDKKNNPSELLYFMNDILWNQTSGNFVTAFYGIYDSIEKSFLYSNAGHPLPYIIDDKVSQLQKANSIALAMFDNDFLKSKNKFFQNFEVNLQVGTKLLLYTDGFTEARKLDGYDFFEYNNLQDIMVQNRHLQGTAYLNSLYDELLNFRQADTFEDDICLIVLDIK